MNKALNFQNYDHDKVKNYIELNRSHNVAVYSAVFDGNLSSKIPLILDKEIIDVSNNFNFDKAQDLLDGFIFSSNFFILFSNGKVLGNISSSEPYTDFIKLTHKIKNLIEL